MAVVIFAFLSILLWNVCFNRHSMTGVVIENKNQLKIEATEKSKFDSFNELGLEQLVEIIYRSSGQESKSFYRVLLQTVKNSSISQKEELIEYIEKRYL